MGRGDADGLALKALKRRAASKNACLSISRSGRRCKFPRTFGRPAQLMETGEVASGRPPIPRPRPGFGLPVPVGCHVRAKIHRSSDSERTVDEAPIAAAPVHRRNRGICARCGLMRRSKHRGRMQNSKRVLSASTLSKGETRTRTRLGVRDRVVRLARGWSNIAIFSEHPGSDQMSAVHQLSKTCAEPSVAQRGNAQLCCPTDGKVTFARLALLFVSLLLVFSIVNRLEAQQHPSAFRRLNLDHGIILRYPANWSPTEQYFSNAIELVAPAGRARTLITATRETDHASALRRLADVAAEVAAPSRYLSIGGWPGLERHYLFSRGRTGQPHSAHGEDRAWRVTTAIAADAVLVRLETTYKAETLSSLGRRLKDRVVSHAALFGRLTIAPRRGMPNELQREIEVLRKDLSSPSPFTELPAEITGDLGPGPVELASSSDQQATAVGLSMGELEIAASKDGKHVVIAANKGYAVSHDGGPFSATSWTEQVGPFPFKHRGDPSVTVGLSKAFYYAYIGLPEGEMAAKGATGCSTAIGRSVDNGQTFHFLSHAGLCPKAGVGKCFPDQAHIAADQVNAGADGADQLYSVYRTCSGLGTEKEKVCGETSTWCRGKPSIVCSKNGGEAWTQPLLIENSGSADFPRVTVASDGFVYVIYRNGNLLKLAKYSSCASGLVMQPGFPLIMPVGNTRLCADDQGLDRCHCPIAGLDRCNNGNLLSSPTVAADDTDPSRVYAAYTVSKSVSKSAQKDGIVDQDDIVVKASTDGGLTWPHEAIINANTVRARRFMPWLCSVNGRAYVTWYDRGAANFADNSLTNYYLGMATFAGGKLAAGWVRNLSGMSDPHCGPLSWPEAPRSSDDSESCQIQPQWAGNCQIRGTASTQRIPCDFGCGAGACRSCPNPSHTCMPGRGAPKYGDYNGNACAAGKIFAAWASRTAPAGPQPQPHQDTPIRIYAVTAPADATP